MQYVVVDTENVLAVGPFDSEKKAKAYFIKTAKSEEWTDVVELIKETGSPFVGEFEQGLQLVELAPPESDEEPAQTFTEEVLVMLLTWYNNVTADGGYLEATEDENRLAVQDFLGQLS